MERKESSLYGNVPEESKAALLIIDVINDLEFPDGEKLQRQAEPMSRRILWLKREAKKLGIPAVYVNDNFGRWQSDFHTLVDHCIGDETRGAEIVGRMKPEEKDYFVLKPKHSGFYSTTLAILLDYLGTEELIITGMAANICVLFTANDAYMRDYKLFVPRDCVASNTEEDNDYALRQMRDVLKADTREAKDLIEMLKEEIGEE